MVSLPPATAGNNVNNKTSLVARLLSWLKDTLKKLNRNVDRITTITKKLAMDDPRRVIHSMKVGLALTLVSLFYYLQPLYDSFGDSGATLGKGLNRVMATLTAAGLTVGTHHLAILCNKVGEAVVIGLFVFIIGATSTFLRFFPIIKAQYDNGLLIFILTYSFITISGYRGETNIIETAHMRLSTIVIGALICLLINIFIFPVWAGEELHNSVALNMEKLAHFLEGLGALCVKLTKVEDNSKDENKSSSQAYKSVLNSKHMEEMLANLARWEPRHGHFMYRHPWNQYIKLGGLTRQCAYKIDSLNAYFNHDGEISQSFEEEMREACTKISLESSKTLKELGSCLRAMTYPSSLVNAHILRSKEAMESLKTYIKSTSLNSDDQLLQMVPIVTIAFLLIDIVDYTEKIAASSNDLAALANFDMVKVIKSSVIVYPEVSFNEAIEQVSGVDCSRILIVDTD
ncbi:aluminum-activated malate transporter 2 isoform X2 [Spinacia oleracea]|uniref:Aluminum-activated malate transporter 2 isoform X2 n=1 Tax=Spinacia oleracea TaxID=3562 RepID=A0ABM3QMF2_SPIOL|nr:aluminum-activated malate transporter 2-like isoform X2 [Spinacia oleracea]